MPSLLNMEFLLWRLPGNPPCKQGQGPNPKIFGSNPNIAVLGRENPTSVPNLPLHVCSQEVLGAALRENPALPLLLPPCPEVPGLQESLLSPSSHSLVLKLKINNTSPLFFPFLFFSREICSCYQNCCTWDINWNLIAGSFSLFFKYCPRKCMKTKLQPHVGCVIESSSQPCTSY